MRKYINFILGFPIAVFVLLFFIACEKLSENPVIFKQDSLEQLDSICYWLEDRSNFNEENYKTVFYDYYNQKIDEQDFIAAAKALEIVSEQEAFYLYFDDGFFNTLQSFNVKFRSEIPKERATFLDSYLGNYYTEEGEFRIAITYFERIIEIEPVDFLSCSNVAYAYFDIAFCYSAIGEQELALENNLKALEYFNKTDDPSGKGIVYSNLALIYLFTKNYHEAELYSDKAIAEFTLAEDTVNILTCLYNKILLYEDTDNPKKFELIDYTYHFFNEYSGENESLKVSIYSYYVENLLHEEKLESAKQLLDEMKQSVDVLHSSSSTAEYYVALAEYELKAFNKILNLELIEQVIPSLEENEHYQTQVSFYNVLKQDAINKNDFEKALYYSEKSSAAQNNLASEEIRIKTIELDKKHQSEKKEQQIALQQEVILNSNTTIALLISILIGFFLTVIIITTKQKQKKAKLESIKAQLYTKQILEKTEEERMRIASDLHDSISHALIILKNSIAENQSDAGEKIDAIINDIRIISRNLHPVMFEKVGLKASIEQLIERTQSVNSFMVTADIRYDSTLSVSDELQVYRIIQEALSNIIKYADALAAKITIFENKDTVFIEIKDNGKGFDVETELSKTAAFGLHNIIERSKAINGFAKISSDKNGTVISIEIKKSK